MNIRSWITQVLQLFRSSHLFAHIHTLERERGRERQNSRFLNTETLHQQGQYLRKKVLAIKNTNYCFQSNKGVSIAQSKTIHSSDAPFHPNNSGTKRSPSTMLRWTAIKSSSSLISQTPFTCNIIQNQTMIIKDNGNTKKQFHKSEAI